MRTLIFGATGLLGKPLMRAWGGDEVTGLGSKETDIRDAAKVSEVIKNTKPDWTVLAAAYTDVDGCETNRDLAFAVNCQGAVNVARAAKQADSRLLFISTDYVFDGKKASPYLAEDPRNPQSVYGHSKAEAEVQLQQEMPDCCIVRTSWLFGVGGKCFPDTILKLAAARPELQVVNDQRGSPTLADDLAAAIVQLCHANAEGIVHATNRGECTWFDFAREIVAGAGLKATVTPTTSDKFPRPAKRPEYSVLSLDSLSKFNVTMPTWQDALKRYLAQRG